ncbi:MAG: tRNA (guanosine(46)-N7)-methyltransferase TrmB [Rickettsiales bacterium]|nr:tRNA (guanosine(46)-N7)-methyltransferase TrmB [Rickettsiales bacterium]
MNDFIGFKSKSFVLGRGRITSSQKTAIEKYKKKWVLEIIDGHIAPDLIFGRKAPLMLEIGFGMGDFLINYAIQNPSWNVIGIEVYRAGIGKVLRTIKKNEVNNLRLIEGDAVEICQKMFGEKTFQTINLFFPDPWPKKKHHKRRIVDTEFIKNVAKILDSSGVFFCSTDNENYANFIKNKLNESKIFTIQKQILLKKNNKRFISKFEQRAIDSNSKIFNFAFEKI